MFSRRDCWVRCPRFVRVGILGPVFDFSAVRFPRFLASFCRLD
jgi:hypothetical protein